MKAEYEAAYRLLENHKKRALCKRAGGVSTEYMVNIDAAAGIIANLLVSSPSQTGEIND